MTGPLSLPPPFEGFPSWQTPTNPIWLQALSWFYGVALKDIQGTWRLAVCKLFLGARGLELPSLPRAEELFIDEHDLKAGSFSLDARKVIEVLTGLSLNALHPVILEHFDVKLQFPAEKPGSPSRWQQEEETGHWVRYPRQLLSRNFYSSQFSEWLSPSTRRRLNGVLVGKDGGTFLGLKEIVSQLRFRHHGISSSGVDSAAPAFEVSAELPLQLTTFSYVPERRGYVVRVLMGADIAPERVRMSLGGGPRRSSMLSEPSWRRTVVNAGLHEMEWLVPGAHGGEEVTAELHFDGVPIAEHRLPANYSTNQVVSTLEPRPVRPPRREGETEAPEVPPALVGALQSRQCVLFAGAGLSMAAGLPSWTQMIYQLLDWGQQEQLLAPDLVDTLQEGLGSDEFGLVADTLAGAMQSSAPRFARFLHGLVQRPDAELTEQHKLLRSLPFAGVVTQNLDQLLEQTLPDFPVYTSQGVEHALSALSREEPFLMKLLGTSTQPDTVLISPVQYKATFASNHYFEKFLESILASKTLLFIGNSLDGIRDALAPLKLSGPPTQQHFALISAEDRAWRVKAHTLTQRYGITFLPYPAGEHRRVVEFLYRLRDAVAARPAGQEESIAPVLTRLQMEDIGPFEKLELELSPGWNVLLGDNGVGKSIILKALAVALSGADARPYADRLIRAGRPSGLITLQTARQRYVTQIIRTDAGAEVRSSPGSPLQLEGLLAIGIPPLRGAGQESGERVDLDQDRPTSADLLPLVKGEPDPRMQGLKEWILQMDHLRQKELAERTPEASGGQLLEDFFGVIREVTPGLNLQQLRVEPKRQLVLVSTDDGEIPIDNVSQGTASVINWVGVVLRRLYAVAGPAANPQRHRPVLVLLDEFDAHMHPAWQRTLVPALRRLFPMMQVVASTHSPLVVPVLEPGAISVLYRDPETRRVQLRRSEEDVQGYRADQILTSDMFGLETTHSPEIFEALRRYTQLSTQETLTPAEEQELRRVSYTLKAKIPSPEERKQAREAYRLIQAALDARLEQLDPREAGKLVEEAQAQLVETVTGLSRLP